MEYVKIKHKLKEIYLTEEECKQKCKEYNKTISSLFPEVKKLDSGKEVSNITIAVPRSYKNAEGEYETDFIDCELWGNIANTTSEYCKVGDMIGVKGRLETNIFENDKGDKIKKTVLVADRITFLSSTKEKEVQAEPEME